jgi:hypothetical protein
MRGFKGREADVGVPYSLAALGGFVMVYVGC